MTPHRITLALLLLPIVACENFRLLKKASSDSLPKDAGPTPQLAAPTGPAPARAAAEESRGGDSAREKGQPDPRNPLLVAIDTALRQVKPDLETTSLVSLLPVRHSGSKWYMVLAVGRGPHRGWRRLEDVGEVYGAFWVDSTLTKVSSPVDLFPTRRNRDYEVRLIRVWDTNVIVCARGATYGDAYMQRRIPLEPGRRPLERVQVDTAYHKSGEVDPFCGPAGPDEDLP